MGLSVYKDLGCYVRWVLCVCLLWVGCAQDEPVPDATGDATATPGEASPSSDHQLACGTGESVVELIGTRRCTCESYGICGDAEYTCRPLPEAEGRKVCACADERCPADQECSGPFGTCAAAGACGRKKPCAEPEKFCDLAERVCRPLSGACQDEGDCPSFDYRIQALYRVSCQKAGYCSLSAAPPRIPATEGIPAIEVLSPLPLASYRGGGDPVFRWDPPGTPVFVLVTDQVPQNLKDVAGRAIWGLVIAAGQPGEARWSQGSAVEDGTWLAEAPPVPENRPLYLVVEGRQEGALTRISDLVPFRYGGSFSSPGQPCVGEDILPGACQNPIIPQICHGGLCRVLCASGRDCSAQAAVSAGLAPGLQCGPPHSGLRYCE